MIERVALSVAVREALARSPAVALVGPRQVGKTTLARAFLAVDSPQWFDLEDPQVEAQLVEPLVALRDLRGLVVIDEIRHAPDLFKVLRVLIDRPGLPARFLLLGSASPGCANRASRSPGGSKSSRSAALPLTRPVSRARLPCGCAVASPVPSPRPMMPAAPSGDASSSARPSSGICRNSA
jgi:predicted AAA+ superfamily ATPase